MPLAVKPAADAGPVELPRWVRTRAIPLGAALLTLLFVVLGIAWGGFLGMRHLAAIGSGLDQLDWPAQKEALVHTVETLPGTGVPDPHGRTEPVRAHLAAAGPARRGDRQRAEPHGAEHRLQRSGASRHRD